MVQFVQFSLVTDCLSCQDAFGFGICQPLKSSNRLQQFPLLDTPEIHSQNTEVSPSHRLIHTEEPENYTGKGNTDLELKQHSMQMYGRC